MVETRYGGGTRDEPALGGGAARSLEIVEPGSTAEPNGTADAGCASTVRHLEAPTFGDFGNRGRHLVARVDGAAERDVSPAIFEPTLAKCVKDCRRAPAIYGDAADKRSFEAELLGNIRRVDGIGNVRAIRSIEEGGDRPG